MLIKTMQQAKRIMKIILGFTLLVLGAVLVFTPGPGWLVMLLGLGVLAAEFMWARKLLDRMKEQGVRLRDAFFARPHPPANHGV
ncbi:MAG TPA: PGPGW domain-containing protein [Candidatus Acidoferrum sp.]|nr:PGPGW domain-containing protein [Candidatus Acidoferrum sp.]